MPKFVNPNSYPIDIAMSQPVAVRLQVVPHAWPASRLNYNSRQVIELDDAFARTFVKMGMLAELPEDGSVLTTPVVKPEGVKTALSSLLADNEDFDQKKANSEDNRPLTKSTKTTPAIPKGEGTYVVAETEYDRIVFLAGPLLKEAGLEKLAAHFASFAVSGYQRLSLVYGDTEEEASRSRRYGHFLEKVLKEHDKGSPSPGVIPVTTPVSETARESEEESADEKPLKKVRRAAKKQGKPAKVEAVAPRSPGAEAAAEEDANDMEIADIHESVAVETAPTKPVFKLPAAPAKPAAKPAFGFNFKPKTAL